MSVNKGKARRFAMTLALAAGLSSLPAPPQPGHHGMHGGSPLAHAILSLKTQLNLTASQQAQLDAAIAAGRAARDAARQSRQTVMQLAKDELAKTTPDLAKVSAAQDQAMDAATNARRGVRNQLLQLYATFTPAQVAVVKEALSHRMDRMESFRDRMRQRFGG
jgi:Spy/CpxP family protein refolding chaperone